jgi:predicted nucleic acid-binding protein
VIVVDSSVWICALRSRTSPEAITLGSLLDADEVALAAPVRTEILMGARGADRAKLADALRGVPMLYPADHTWQTIDTWTARASRAGHTFAIADLLIAALTAEIGGLIWSHDADFRRMEELDLVRRYDI